MDAAAVDLLLIDSGELLAWLTGYTVSETMYRAAFLPREGDAWLVLRSLDEAPCREKTWIKDIVGFSDTDAPHAIIASSLRARGYDKSHVGADFAGYAFNATTLDRLQALLPAAAFTAMPGVSDSLRWVKSKAEIDVLTTAASIADLAMAAIAAQTQGGMTTRDAAAIAASVFIREGADTGEVGPIVKASGSHEFLHGSFKNQTLEKGDILHVELIPKVGNYGARLMRPVVIGEPSALLTAASKSLISLQDEQIEAMKPGALARDVDAIVRDGLVKAGLRTGYTNVTAYTLGLYTRTPRTSDFSRVFLPNSDWLLETGMVFHVYATTHGMGFSETVVVTPQGGKRLTLTPRRILQSA
jgi:Xaa-Pro dipeptidase